MTPEEAIRRLQQLETDRSNWASYWQDLANFCLPKKANIVEKKTNNPRLDFHHLFDNTAINSLKIMSAGFHSHLTNPSTKWFGLKMKDKNLMTEKAVKVWLQDVEDIIFTTLDSSNFDSIMQEFYEDTGVFGTGAIFEEEDIQDKVRFTMLPIGEIFIEEDYQGRVNRIFRKFEYTVQQAYDRWGDDAGQSVKKAIAEKSFNKTVAILHWIVPREKRVAGKEDALNMPYESKWINIADKHLIRESGFEEFPVAVGRFWKNTAERWGFSPAMGVLADIKMINAEKKILIRAAMKITDPPLALPQQGFIMPLNLNPSGLNYYNSQTKSDALQPLLTKGNIPVGIDMIRDVKESIEEGFFVPLFKAFSQITKQMTIPEVQRRISENMVLLGPVVGRFTQEVFDPIIIRTFNILFRNGFLPEPPESIQGQEFDVVYISLLAKAQRATEIVSLEKTLVTVGQVAGVLPNVLDKIDGDKIIDIVVDINGNNPEILRDQKEVEIIRQQRAEQQAKIDKQADMKVAAEIAEKVGATEKNLQPAGAGK